VLVVPVCDVVSVIVVGGSVGEVGGSVGEVGAGGVGMLKYDDESGPLNSRALGLLSARVGEVPVASTRRRLALIFVELPGQEALGVAERPGCSHSRRRFPALRPEEVARRLATLRCTALDGSVGVGPMRAESRGR
jgi:hypothetical protein